jgi:hypothetical protein
MVSSVVAKPDYVTVYLDSDVKRRFKAQCALEGIEMSATAAVLIENWLKERDRTKSKGAK